MGIVAALGNTVGNIVLATAIINLPFYVRVARAEANVRRNAGWWKRRGCRATAMRASWRVHLFPNSLPPAMVQVSLNMGWAILNAAGLSFIGLGVRPPTPEWGILVAEGAQFIVSGRMVGQLLSRRGADAGGVHLQPAGRRAARHLRSAAAHMSAAPAAGRQRLRPGVPHPQRHRACAARRQPAAAQGRDRRPGRRKRLGQVGAVATRCWASATARRASPAAARCSAAWTCCGRSEASWPTCAAARSR